MRKLIQGIVEFRKSLTEENRELFAKLATQQKPDALFIACSDSRVVPNLFVSTNPGDLFVVRNMGNLIPPDATQPHDSSAGAAIEYAISTLNVKDIIVCGHSECGAMKALAEGIEPLSANIQGWLQYGLPSLERVKKGFIPNPSLALHNQISQANVLQQIEHIASYPIAKERFESKKLRFHGWWFDIAHADVYCYEQNLNQFVLIEENEGNVILQRLTP